MLVAEQGECSGSLVDRGNELRHALQLDGSGQLELGRGIAKQAQHRDNTERDRGAGARAQESRDVPALGEAPPQVVGVVDVFEREEAHPDTHPQHGDDCRHPPRRERLGQE